MYKRFCIINFDLQKIPSSVKLATTATQLKPESREAFTVRAKTQLEVENFQEALADLKEALLRAEDEKQKLSTLHVMKELLNKEMKK